MVGIRARTPAPVPLLLSREAPSEGTEWEGKGEAVTLPKWGKSGGPGESLEDKTLFRLSFNLKS